MNLDEAYHRIKFQAHPRTELGRVGGPLVDEIDRLRAQVDSLGALVEGYRERLAEHERTQATGGPPPPETRGWANEAIVPAPETAHDQSMAVPDRYQRSDAHLRDGGT